MTVMLDKMVEILGDTPDLTDRQRQVLEYLIVHHMREGSPPSFREIMTEFNIKSPTGVSVHFKALVRKGYVERTSLSRGYKVKGINWVPVREYAS